MSVAIRTSPRAPLNRRLPTVPANSPIEVETRACKAIGKRETFFATHSSMDSTVDNCKQAVPVVYVACDSFGNGRMGELSEPPRVKVSQTSRSWLVRCIVIHNGQRRS